MPDTESTNGDPWGLPIEETDSADEDGLVPDVEPITEPVEEVFEEAAGTFEDTGEEVIEEAAETFEYASEDTGEEVIEEAAETFEYASEDTGEEVIEEAAEAFEYASEDTGEEVIEEAAYASEDTGEEAAATYEAASEVSEEASADVEETALEEAAEAAEAVEPTLPRRTPLSQMIAAAQSVVSSIQGDQTSEPAEPEERSEEPEATEEASEGVGEEPEEEAAEPVRYAAGPDQTTDEDLPEEPPPWLVMEEEAFEPEGEAAALDEARFAEDQFGVEVAETTEEVRQELEGIDLDSTPGVFDELRDLDVEESRAEALLQEAAAALRGADAVDETPSEDLTGDLDGLTEALAGDLETPDIVAEPADGLTEALAGGLGGETPDIEIVEEETIEESTADLTGDLDGLTEALAGGLGGETPDIEIVEEETIEEPAADLTGDLDGLTEALAGDLEAPDIEIVEEETVEEPAADLAEALTGDLGEERDTEPADRAWEVSEPVSDDELADALARLDQEPVEVEPMAGEYAGGEDEVTDLGAAVAALGERLPEIPESVAEGTPTQAPVAAEAAEEQPAEEQPAEEAVGIETPVEWGARYKQVQQGWVDDTWRPIVTSGESVAGWDIDIYLGIVSGDMMVPSEPTGIAADEIATARTDATRQMLDEALARGAHAVVGLRFAVQEVAGSVLVSASGVAVTLRTPS